MSITKVFTVPLRQFSPPALLVAHGHVAGGETWGECFLIHPSTDPATKITYRCARLPRLVDDICLYTVALLLLEENIRGLADAVPLDERSDRRELNEAAPLEVSARRALGQYASFDQIDGLTRDPALLAYLRPYSGLNGMGVLNQ